MSNIYALIMAGGQGTRLWPASTSSYPKQYLTLVGEDSLLEQTLARLDGLATQEYRYIITTEEQKNLAAKVLGTANFILEPAGKNTAPCILFALEKLQGKLQTKGAQEEDVVIILPSDHIVLNKNNFHVDLKKAVELARTSETIVTLGIVPHFPHTGYGYIELGEGHKVRSFKEKPDLQTAKNYLSAGNFFWNSGIFITTIKTLKEEFAVHAPELFSHFGNLQTVYNNLSANSIDYMIMEKSSRISLIPATFDWNDLGSWEALESIIEKNDNNSVVNCNGTLFESSSGNIVYAPDTFVTLMGVNDLVVVQSGSVLAVFPKSEGQNIKKIVDKLKGGKFEKLL